MALYFNSIKVRLEPTLIVTSFGANIFQFHKGTIRTRHLVAKWLNEKYFNSIKVRLEQCGSSTAVSFC